MGHGFHGYVKNNQRVYPTFAAKRFLIVGEIP